MKFVLTKELGKLARWLRILGFDTIYYKSDNLGTLIIEALRDDRIIITRRKTKIDDLEKRTVTITFDRLEDQLCEVRVKLNLKIEENKMFMRCPLCNEMLKGVKKEEIKELIPKYVYEHQDFFRQCFSCQKIYWQGSHWENIKKVMGGLKRNNEYGVCS